MGKNGRNVIINEKVYFMEVHSNLYMDEAVLKFIPENGDGVHTVLVDKKYGEDLSSDELWDKVHEIQENGFAENNIVKENS